MQTLDLRDNSGELGKSKPIQKLMKELAKAKKGISVLL
jgi:hypothetical protein